MAFFDHFTSTEPTALGRGFTLGAARMVLSAIVRRHPGARDLLEIGPGRGDFAGLWSTERGAVTALEANPSMAEALAARGIEVIQALAPPLPCQAQCFDVALACHLIEHMPTAKEAESLVAEMARVCRPGGLVVLVAPDIRSWRFDFWNADYSHNFVTSPRRLAQLLGNAGVQVEEVVEFSGTFTGWKGWLVALAARCIPSAAAEGGLWMQRLYKLKLTFLGNVLIIGRKGMRP